MDITWQGHASFKIKTDSLIYIDPWELNKPEPADIILISHSHYDHFSLPDIKKIRTPKTQIVCPADCAANLKPPNINIVKPGDNLTFEKTKLTMMPFYNLNKKFHPKAAGWVGFIIEFGKERLYYAGDTDHIPEMDLLKDITYALLPIGGTYTMTPEEAAAAANIIKPKFAIPYHWGKIVGSESDAQKFKKLFKGETMILPIKN